MKIRNGFVSNSSSTSFVFLGIKVDSDDPRLEQYAELHKLGIAVIDNDGYGYIGIKIANGEDEWLDESENTLAKLAELAHFIAFRLSLPNTFDIKLYTGMRAS